MEIFKNIQTLYFGTSWWFKMINSRIVIFTKQTLLNIRLFNKTHILSQKGFVIRNEFRDFPRSELIGESRRQSTPPPVKKRSLSSRLSVIYLPTCALGNWKKKEKKKPLKKSLNEKFRFFSDALVLTCVRATRRFGFETFF